MRHVGQHLRAMHVARVVLGLLLRGEINQVFDSALQETAERLLPLAVNDIMDREGDRQHPLKCRRPIAAGELSVPSALVAAAAALADVDRVREHLDRAAHPTGGRIRNLGRRHLGWRHGDLHRRQSASGAARRPGLRARLPACARHRRLHGDVEPRQHDDEPGRLSALARGLDFGIVLQQFVHDPALTRAHRLQRDGAVLAQRLALVVGGVVGDGSPAPLLPTAAGHDAGILAAAGVPTAMLFVRNPTGISHSPVEHADVDDCHAGVDALAAVVTELA